MLRYHKKVFFDPKDTESLKAFTNRLNGLEWRYSSHSIEGLKYRAIDLESLLLFVKDIKLNDNQLFEYYAEDKSRELRAVS